jgi:hypothetical protein
MLGGAYLMAATLSHLNVWALLLRFRKWREHAIFAKKLPQYF